MDYRHAAQEALDIQNASNLSGVVHTFATVCEALWDEARNIGESTRWVNEHPIVALFLGKLRHLNGNRDESLDWELVQNISKGGHPDVVKGEIR